MKPGWVSGWRRWWSYARRAWQEQAFRDLKSGGWHWHESHLLNPDHVARLRVVLVIAYVWSVALGSQAVAAQLSQPLIRRADRPLGRLFSLFREGLDFLIQVVEARSLFVGLLFTPDARFTLKLSHPLLRSGEGMG